MPDKEPTIADIEELALRLAADAHRLIAEGVAAAALRYDLVAPRAALALLAAVSPESLAPRRDPS